MTRTEIIERVAAGIRNMDVAPDAFLFSRNSEYDWNETEIIKIPVFFTDDFMLYHYNENIGDPLCLFLPMWRDIPNSTLLTKYFFEGWGSFNN